MLRASSQVVVTKEPREVLEWVLDLDRYKTVDHKIGTIVEHPQLSDRDAATATGRVRYRGKLRGLPTPVDTNDVTLERWDRLRFTGTPGVWTRRVVDFEGSFECSSAETGTLVVHREQFQFKPAPLRWLAETFLRQWLDADIDAEMQRFERAIETGETPAVRSGAQRRITAIFERRVINPFMRLVIRRGWAPSAFSLLETTGRTTGLPRVTPVGNGRDGDTFWLVAEHGRRGDYVKNLIAAPAVRVLVDGAWRTGTAHIVDDDDGLARRRAIDESHGIVGRFDGLAFRASATDPLTIRIDMD